MFIKRNNFLSQWWHNIDHILAGVIVALILTSLLLVYTASPAVAMRIGLKPSYFIIRQCAYHLVGAVLIFGLSVLEYKTIRRLAIVGLLANLMLMVLVPFYGLEIKGARRWFNFAGVSIQPSELLKPMLWVVIGWLASVKQYSPKFPGFRIIISVYFLVVLLLLMQPDFGTLLLISFIVLIQLFASGLPIVWVIGTGLLGIFGIAGAYWWFPHVSRRINMFLSGEGEQNYQVTKSLEAFISGGISGKGLGEGIVKQHIPDSHTDFIFAVAGEEFGALACLLINAIFAILVTRGYIKLSTEETQKSLAGAGILAQLGLQSIINMGVNLHMLPTKGMTLPMISYGGSSVFSTAIGLGILLSFTKRKQTYFRYQIRA